MYIIYNHIKIQVQKWKNDNINKILIDVMYIKDQWFKKG